MKLNFFPVRKFEIILPKDTDPYKSLSENTEKSKISRRVITFKYFIGEVDKERFRITLSGMLAGWLTTGATCVVSGRFDNNKIILSINVYKPFKILTLALLIISTLSWFYQVYTHYSQVYNFDYFINDILSLVIVVALMKIMWEIDCWISQKIIFHRLKKFLDIIEIKRLS